MVKSDHSMFNINKDLLVYKAFYFFFLSGFGSVFPYLPVYFRQIGLTADQVGLIVGMRPIVQFASAPFWAVMADKYKKRKAVLVMSVLSWLIMTLALAFVEPTNEICELRVANTTHTHYVNYTKVKTGFFRRSLLYHDVAVQEHGKDVEASPDLVVVPMEKEAESNELGSGSGDRSSPESLQLFQFQTKIRLAKQTGYAELHTQHIGMFPNSSQANGTEITVPKEVQRSNKTFNISPSDPKINGSEESIATKLLKINVNEGNYFDNLNNSATRWTNNTAQSLKQLVRRLRNATNAVLAAKGLETANKDHDEEMAAKDVDTFNHSDDANENNNEKEKTLLEKWDEFSDTSGSGQIVEKFLGKRTKTKRHDMTKTVPIILKAKEGNDNKGSSTKKKKSAPVVFDFSQFLPEVSEQNLKNTVNASWQTIGFKSHLSETERQLENGSTLEHGSGEEERKLENGTNRNNNNNNNKSYDINKDQITDMKELSKIYGINSKANISIFAFENVEDEIKNSVPSTKNVSNQYFNHIEKHVSKPKTNSTEASNSSNHNSLPAAKLTLQATLTGADHLHEGDMERTRGEMLHHKDKVIHVPYSAFRFINFSDKKNNSSSLAKQSESKVLKISQFLLEKPTDKEDTWMDTSGENSGFSKAMEDEFSSTTTANRNNSTESPTSSLPAVDTLQQLKITTKNLLKTNPIELNRIFVILMILIVVGEFLESPSFTLADAALLELLGEERRYYGKQRLWGSLGFGIFSFIVGLLLEKSRHTVCGEPYTDYMICFCVFAIIMVLTLFTSTKFQFEYGSTSHAGTSVLSALCNVHYGSCLMAACFMGFGHGMSHNFINWFLEDLGGSKTLMGVAVICRSLSDLTMFFVAGFVIKLVGQIKMMLLSLFCYGVIFTSYSLLENSWSVLPIELLNGMTYAAAWSACTSYMAGASTADAVTTIQGILQGVYWGLGSGSGAISGGLMIHHIGAVATFRFTAGGFFLGCIAFGLAQWRYDKETADRPPQRKYSYLPATPEGKDTEALLSGFFTGSSKSERRRYKKKRGSRSVQLEHSLRHG